MLEVRKLFSSKTERTVCEADADLGKVSERVVVEMGETREHAFVLSSNLPFGVSIKIDGGRNGYSEGRRIRKWYNPPSNSVPVGPRMVQCHSLCL